MRCNQAIDGQLTSILILPVPRTESRPGSRPETRANCRCLWLWHRGYGASADRGGFRSRPISVRPLLAFDIASEGLNLHFLCHKLIHFEIPWSLMVFQQRNGRIDRYGQEKQPHIAYLYTEPEHPKVKGDLRILELLMEKDVQAAKNIGNPSVFLGVFDVRREIEMTARAIEDGLAPAEFSQRMETAAEDDLLSILFGDDPVPAGQSAPSRCHTFPSLFEDDLAYFRNGLTALRPSIDLQEDFDSERQLVTITVNDELRRTFRALPSEALLEDGRLHFTTSRDRVKKPSPTSITAHLHDALH